VALPINLDSAIALAGTQTASTATNKNRRFSALSWQKEKAAGTSTALITSYKLAAFLSVSGSAA
jgi:hypothetical protein